MNDRQPSTIVFAWWNTALSPSAKRGRADDNTKRAAAQIVQLLVNDYGVDFLALGEVTSLDLDFLIKESGIVDYSVNDGTFQKGRVRFDTAVLSNNRTLQVLKATAITEEYAKASIKVANRFDLRVVDTDDQMYAFVCHWPSRLHCSEGDAKRDELGMRLRRVVDEIRTCSQGPVYAILLGDFNDEPFDKSLAKHLLATRDRGLVRRDDRFLYNPFWRHLGELGPHIPKHPCATYPGTCFYSRGDVTQWNTFDQIIFSAAFLRESDWQLNESYSRVLRFQELGALICDSKYVFDHFPVISVVEHNTLEVSDDD